MMSSIGPLSPGRLAAAYAGSTDALAARPATAERAEPATEKRAKETAAQEAQEPVVDASATRGTLIDTYL